MTCWLFGPCTQVHGPGSPTIRVGKGWAGDAGSLLPGVLPPELVASHARAWDRHAVTLMIGTTDTTCALHTHNITHNTNTQHHTETERQRETEQEHRNREREEKTKEKKTREKREDEREAKTYACQTVSRTIHL